MAMRDQRWKDCSADERFEAHSSAILERKIQESANRCKRCWHDRKQRCICQMLQSEMPTVMPIKVLVLMHHKEYLNAGDDAKLLLAMLPASRAQLFVYGKSGDLLALEDELAVDPVHTLLLWPGDGAYTVEEYVSKLPTSGWSPGTTGDANGTDDGLDRPLLRVLVLDGVYKDARHMFRKLRKRATAAGRAPTQHVALHPSTVSVYHRAAHGYAQASASRVNEETAMRICTVEAVALLFQELG